MSSVRHYAEDGQDATLEGFSGSFDRGKPYLRCWIQLENSKNGVIQSIHNGESGGEIVQFLGSWPV